MSTDSSQLIDNNVAVSQDLLYTVKPSAVRCRQYRSSIPSSNGVVFTPQQTSIFYIPARNNCFLSGKETVLKFTVRATNSANLTPKTDGFGSSLISSISIFHGSNLLETINQSNVLYSLLWDATLDPSQRVGLSALYGGSSDIANPRAGATITATSTVTGNLTVCIPLISAIAGVQMDKMLPLSLGDDIRVEITWSNEQEGLVKSGSVGDTYITGYSTDWVIQSPEMVCTILELDQQGMAMVNSVAPPSGETVLHGQSWRSYNSTMPANSSGGSFSTIVPCRFCSMNAILLAPRLSSTAVLKTGYSVSNRINPGISQYFWRIGGGIVPNKPVILYNPNTTGGYSEGILELIKAFGVLNTPASTSSLRSDYYNVAKTATPQQGAVKVGTTDSTSAFAIGAEFNSFSGKNDVLLSGINTLSTNCFFECEVDSSGNDAMVLNFFAQYDALFVITDGLISVRF
jgi:hypothetical protein